MVYLLEIEASHVNPVSNRTVNSKGETEIILLMICYTPHFHTFYRVTFISDTEILTG